MVGLKCLSCPSNDAKVIRVEAQIGKRRRQYVLHACRPCWRALEAMFEPKQQYEWDDLFVPRRGLFLW